MTSLILIGAGGFGIEAALYAQDMVRTNTASFEVKGFLDDTKEVGDHRVGLPILGGTDMPVDPSALYVITIAEPPHKRAFHERLAAQGARFATLIHPSAVIAPTAQVGEGCVFAPFSFAGPESFIGRHGTINIYGSVAHETRLGDFCTFSPYAGTHGAAQLGDGIFMGAHATVLKGIKIGNACKIAAGAVVYNDMPDAHIAIGNPARFKNL
ncbi:MAG: NeuD/PglB/VioB family sugar acetyltransferase [Bdellovibrionales bacterium]